MPRSKKLLWKEQDMVAAVQSVRSGKLSIRKAAAEFNVPKSSLANRINGRVDHGKKNGPETLLDPADEAVLAAFHLTHVSKHGYASSKDNVMRMATQMAEKRGKEVKKGCVSEKWWHNFLKRHPEVLNRVPQNETEGTLQQSKPELQSPVGAPSSPVIASIFAVSEKVPVKQDN